MRIALREARAGIGYVNPNPLVGAVIVKDGDIIGKGAHLRYGTPHAERNALASCKVSPEGADMYVTLEPCCHFGKNPPCTDAISAAGIRRVFIGSDDPNPLVAGKGKKKLRESGIEVIGGVLKDECDRLNEIFFHYITENTPFVTMKYAMSMDGKTAVYTGESRWITSDAARQAVHRDRMRYSAVMTGIGTVIADDPQLTCRLENGRDPVRIICDSELRIPLESRIVSTACGIPTIIAACRENSEKQSRLEEAGCHIVFTTPDEEGHVDLRELMNILGKNSIDSILLEGGGKLNSSALRCGIVDKIKAFIAPKLIGGKDSPSPVMGKGIEKLKDAVELEIQSVERVGCDLLIESRVSDKKCLPE